MDLTKSIASYQSSIHLRVYCNNFQMLKFNAKETYSKKKKERKKIQFAFEIEEKKKKGKKIK